MDVMLSAQVRHAMLCSSTPH